MGDFIGLTRKLDYLQDLGVTTLWLLPFCPSTWKDDGYDISDYTSVHPAYGSLRDFQVLLREAHRRDLHARTRRGPGALPVDPRQARRRNPDPLSRCARPAAGALSRQGFRLPGFRG
jgi:hypothetical protein